MRFLGALAVTFVATFLAAPAAAAPAESDSGSPSVSASAPTLEQCNPGWYVNPDETSRKPTPGPGGLTFEGNDLIHKAANLPLADLEPGEYIAVPAPDQPTFFSVEVRNTNGAYGTLRWDRVKSKWTIVIGSGTAPGGEAATSGAFEHADPVALLTGKVTKWGAFDPATAKVVSFGVGYTNSPPGTVKTVVSSVMFQGTAYSLKCAPKPSGSPSASATLPGSASPTPAPGVGGELALTGTRPWLLGGTGLALLLTGFVAYRVFRRPRVTFRS